MPLFGRQKPGFGIEYQTEENEMDIQKENTPTCVGDILAGFIRQNSRCRTLTGVKDLMNQDPYMPRYMR